MSTTHKSLCELAVTWLQRPASAGGHGCQVAVSEVASGWTGESPDAIGWRLDASYTGSVVVEVKVSRSDFLADRQKPFRAPGQGLGNWRYYLAPEGLIRVEDLPDGWGLVTVNGRGHCKVAAGAILNGRQLGYGELQAQKERWALPSQRDREQWLLVRLLQRLGDPEKLNQERREQFRLLGQLRTRADDMADQLRAEQRECRSLRRRLKAMEERFGVLPEEEAGKSVSWPAIARLRDGQAVPADSETPYPGP